MVIGDIDVVIKFCVMYKFNMIVFGGILIGKIVMVCKIFFFVFVEECIIMIEEVVELCLM